MLELALTLFRPVRQPDPGLALLPAAACAMAPRLKPRAGKGAVQSLCPQLRALWGSVSASRWSKTATPGDAASPFPEALKLHMQSPPGQTSSP